MDFRIYLLLKATFAGLANPFTIVNDTTARNVSITTIESIILYYLQKLDSLKHQRRSGPNVKFVLFTPMLEYIVPKFEDMALGDFVCHLILLRKLTGS
jgi:hypothetical protein